VHNYLNSMKITKPMKIVLNNRLGVSGIPDEFRQDLMEKLQILNPKWVENNRMGRWNRGTPKILKFFAKAPKNGLWLPRGFIRSLILLCRKNAIGYEIEDLRRILPLVDFNFSGQLKPFQQEAMDVILTKEFGTVSAPTGSGKTVMALFALSQRKQPALIVVHTKDLAHQWVDRVEQFLGIPEEEIGYIGGGKKKIGKRVTVALVQSLYRCAEDVSGKIGFLIVDECHRCPSRTFTEAVAVFDSKFMLGLSATPWRRDKLSKVIFWHIGDVHHKVEKSNLIASGDVLRAEVITRETDFKPYYDPVNDYSRMLSELTADDDRNRQIAQDISHEAEISHGICLVLSDRKKHCESLITLLRYKHHVKADLLTGDLSDKQRKEVLIRLNTGKIKVLVATGQLIGEGFDCKNLSTLFLVTPVRFSGRVLQYIGRVLRPAPGKEKARVFDYVDANVEVLVSAANARQKIYGDGSS
jgi:superfamily II DNA or RNA helicase